MRESHVADSIRPKFSTHNLVAIQPGKRIWQFFTLPEVGLAHGEHINLSVYGYQPKGDMIKAKIKLMKLDSEDGDWSPKAFGMADDRTFPKQSRGELVIAKEYKTFQPNKGTVELTIGNAEIIGKTSIGNQSSSKDINTIGIQIEFENTDPSETVWIYTAGETGDITINGTGIIKQLYISANPNKPEIWRNTRFIIHWDGNNLKSIDVPLGYFFGNADYASLFQYNSMVTGITKDGAYSLLPMPFEKGAKLVFENHSKEDIELVIKMDIQEEKSLQTNFGRLHATFNKYNLFLTIMTIVQGLVRALNLFW